MRLWKVPFDAELFEEAMELPVKERGVVTDFDNGSLRLHTLKSGYWGMTLACENCNMEKDVTFTLDCSRSTNVVRWVLPCSRTSGSASRDSFHRYPTLAPLCVSNWLRLGRRRLSTI